MQIEQTERVASVPGAERRAAPQPCVGGCGQAGRLYIAKETWACGTCYEAVQRQRAEQAERQALIMALVQQLARCPEPMLRWLAWDYGTKRSDLLGLKGNASTTEIFRRAQTMPVEELAPAIAALMISQRWDDANFDGIPTQQRRFVIREWLGIEQNEESRATAA